MSGGLNWYLGLVVGLGSVLLGLLALGFVWFGQPRDDKQQ